MHWRYSYKKRVTFCSSSLRRPYLEKLFGYFDLGIVLKSHFLPLFNQFDPFWPFILCNLRCCFHPITCRPCDAVEARIRWAIQRPTLATPWTSSWDTSRAWRRLPPAPSLSFSKSSAPSGETRSTFVGRPLRSRNRLLKSRLVSKDFLFDRTIMIKILTFSLPTQNMLLKLVYLVSTMP